MGEEGETVGATIGDSRNWQIHFVTISNEVKDVSYFFVDHLFTESGLSPFETEFNSPFISAWTIGGDAAARYQRAPDCGRNGEDDRPFCDDAFVHNNGTIKMVALPSADFDVSVMRDTIILGDKTKDLR